MATQTVAMPSPSRPLMWFEKLVLRQAHPAAIFSSAVGWIWFGYFLWMHQWQLGLLSLLIMTVFGFFLARHAVPEEIAETRPGKLALLHLHPVNFAVQVLGFALLIVGLWLHRAEAILGGLSITFLGHIFGWEKVDPRFSSVTKGEHHAGL